MTGLFKTGFLRRSILAACGLLLGALQAAAQTGDPLDIAAASSARDDPRRLYPVQTTRGFDRIIHDGANTARNPVVYAFDDYCRGEVAHVVVHFRGDGRSRLIVKTPADLLGSARYPSTPVSQLASWKSIARDMAQTCPEARAVLLSETYQIHPTAQASATEIMGPFDGHVQQRFALDLSDPDGEWRIVDVGRGPTLNASQIIYYNNGPGVRHVAGRSCDNRATPGRSPCPGVLSVAKDESYICVEDDAFCIVIPIRWCDSLGGRIGSFKNACSNADQRARTVAEILEHMWLDDGFTDRFRTASPQREEVLGRIEVMTRGFIYFSISKMPDEILSQCVVVEDPPNQLAALNSTGLLPAVFGVTMQEISQRRPDLADAADVLCRKMAICEAKAYRDMEPEVLEIARRSIASKLCRSHDDHPIWRMKRRFAELADAIEKAESGRGSFRTMPVWSYVSALARDDTSERARDEMRGYLPVLAEWVTANLGWPTDDVADLAYSARTRIQIPQ